MTSRAAFAGLGHRYPGRDAWALRDVTADLAPGEVLAVVGPSGSGKSTLLRLLTGLLAPTEGEVRIDGADVTRVAPERRPVAMVFQGFALLPHLTVRDNVAFGPRVRREPRRVVERRVAGVAEALDIARLLDRRPGELSGGERQRVALARALVREPVLFCLDEPLSSLDPQLRADARRLLAPLLREEGRCAVYVTHDQAEAMTMGDRVAVLRGGRLEQLATPRELYDAPATAFVASFVGAPPMSLLDGGMLGVRPEDVRLGPGDDGTVVDVEDLGHERHVAVDLGARGRVVARTATAPPLGARVGVTLDRVRRFGPDGRAR
ncbi:MAG TPA: ABC transporter ATP-binding protein [Mycobacteriales bacterium]|jgi:ABC-type sugar transport system ATPase subunit